MSGPVYPILRYADPHAALDFLTEAFGFETADVTNGPDGEVMHAEATYGDGRIMLAPLTDDAALGQSMVYVAVDDPDDHHARAVAAGAEIIQDLTDQPYGSREYGALDLDGNRWYFGTYKP